MPLAPPPEKADAVKFVFAKSLPYPKRMLAVSAAMVLGVLAQLSVSFWGGLVLLLIGTGLSMIKGYDAAPDTRFADEKWGQVTPDEYAKVRAKSKELKRWDEDIFDGTNSWGAACFIIIAVICACAGFALLQSDRPQLGFYWGMDCIVVLVPHWLTGVRSYLTNDKLIIKISQLSSVMRALSEPSDIQVLPMLATAESKKGKDVPKDAKLMLKFLNAPEYFMGVQVQLAINNVQGADLPYLYCVILCRRGFRLHEEFRKVSRGIKSKYDPGLLQGWLGGIGMTMEADTNDDVDFVVVRQTATKTKGYSTTPAQARRVVGAAIELSREILTRVPPAPVP